MFKAPELIINKNITLYWSCWDIFNISDVQVASRISNCKDIFMTYPKTWWKIFKIYGFREYIYPFILRYWYFLQFAFLKRMIDSAKLARLELLSQVDYGLWKHQIRAVLIRNSAWLYVSGDVPRNDQEVTIHLNQECRVVQNYKELESWKEQKQEALILMDITSSVTTPYGANGILVNVQRSLG